MEAREVSGKTVEEAVDLALAEMKLGRADVEIEVLQEGKRGILGWGGEEARVRVTPLGSAATGEIVTESHGEAEQLRTEGGSASADIVGKEVAEELLRLMSVSATVELISPADGESPVMLNISGDDPGVLIGRRGRTLSALQYMVNFIASRKHKSDTRIIVDVAGYRQRRQDELKSMALRIADLVKSNRRSITLEPMLAWERRAVHLTLCQDEDISTGSIGYGDRRKVVISPRRRSSTRSSESIR